MELPFLSVYGRSSSVGWSVVRSVIWWVGWLVGRSVIISCYWSYTSVRRSECLVQFCIVAVLLFVANNRFCCQTGSNSCLSGWPSGSDQLSWRIFLTGGTEYATNFTQRLISRVDFVIILFLQAILYSFIGGYCCLGSEAKNQKSGCNKSVFNKKL